MDIFYEQVVSAYPLHLACYNEKCPNEVIQLLLKKSPGYRHLTHIGSIQFDWGNTRDMGYDNDYGGTPLHYYLSRASNVDLNIVKQLVDPFPRVLLLADGVAKLTPIHILMHNKRKSVF